jgi:hypothetical protein
MRVEPEYSSVGKFFGRDPMYRVPKYQRSYAWESSEIEDFLKDLEDCFDKRKNGNPANHFFGGIVSVERKVTGAVKQHEYELVDGQQRFTSFVLLIASLIYSYKELLVELNLTADIENQEIVDRRIKKLTERYIEFEQEVNRQTNIEPVLCLSKADDPFFKELIRQNNPTVLRASHRRLLDAYNKCFAKIKSLSKAPDINIRLDNLEHIQLVADDDFSLIHIITYDRKEAYRLFQVLNDRGRSLTEGDLLRAKTLELLEGFHREQDPAEVIWDSVLKDLSKTTDNFLRWIYASMQGTRAGSSTLFDDFLEKFYPQHSQEKLDQAGASAILTTTRKLRDEIWNARKIIGGDWPFESKRPITAWDRNRLALLVRELGLTVTMPLLMAACHLTEQQFSEIVSVLERFLFRYKVVVNQHIEAANKIFLEESVVIRNNPAAYTPTTLTAKLKALQNERANDAIFRTALENLSYKVGGGNKPIKYLLMTLEHYKRWFENGAHGAPTCEDKTRVYDFVDTTIEHVYPRNASGGAGNTALEPLKNTLGNLTFMGPTDNVAGGNDDFGTKRRLFQISSVGLNQVIGQNVQWSNAEVEQHLNLLKDMACKVFAL